MITTTKKVVEIDFLPLINEIEVSIVIGLSIYFSNIWFHTNCPGQNRLEGHKTDMI